MENDSDLLAMIESGELSLIASCDEHPNSGKYIEETDGPYDVARCYACREIIDAI